MEQMDLRTRALLLEYNAMKTKALANLENYVSNPAGIGEHADIVEEMSALVKQVADAEGYIKVVEDFLVPKQNPEADV